MLSGQFLYASCIKMALSNSKIVNYLFNPFVFANTGLRKLYISETIFRYMEWVQKFFFLYPAFNYGMKVHQLTVTTLSHQPKINV